VASVWDNILSGVVTGDQTLRDPETDAFTSAHVDTITGEPLKDNITPLLQSMGILSPPDTVDTSVIPTPAITEINRRRPDVLGIHPGSIHADYPQQDNIITKAIPDGLPSVDRTSSIGTRTPARDVLDYVRPTEKPPMARTTRAVGPPPSPADLTNTNVNAIYDRPVSQPTSGLPWGGQNRVRQYDKPGNPLRRLVEGTTKGSMVQPEAGKSLDRFGGVLIDAIMNLVSGQDRSPANRQASSVSLPPNIPSPARPRNTMGGDFNQAMLEDMYDIGPQVSEPSPPWPEDTIDESIKPDWQTEPIDIGQASDDFTGDAPIIRLIESMGLLELNEGQRAAALAQVSLPVRQQILAKVDEMLEASEVGGSE
jgi:hypothetical protein